VVPEMLGSVRKQWLKQKHKQQQQELQ